MSVLSDFARYIERFETARLLSPDGVLTGNAPRSAGLTLLADGVQQAKTDVAGNRTTLYAYKLLARTVLLTEAERAAAQDACEQLAQELLAASDARQLPLLPRGEARAVDCGGVTLTALDDSGIGTYCLPLTLECTERTNVYGI